MNMDAAHMAAAAIMLILISGLVGWLRSRSRRLDETIVKAKTNNTGWIGAVVILAAVLIAVVACYMASRVNQP
jgi:ABC-type Fe3+ transport system permease subunit